MWEFWFSYIKTGIIKHVYQDKTEEELEGQITNTFPDAECDFFMKNEEFMGIIKVKFQTEDQLKEAMQNKISIYNQKYIVEKYISKRRIIRCMKCQRFGHIERLCRETKPVCGKCTSRNHETRQCQAPEANFKCYHCKENHMTGDKECPVIIEKMDELNQSS